jgi:hypothetical protein
MFQIRHVLPQLRDLGASGPKGRRRQIASIGLVQFRDSVSELLLFFQLSPVTGSLTANRQWSCSPSAAQ